jgi:hypothetical protein
MDGHRVVVDNNAWSSIFSVSTFLDISYEFVHLAATTYNKTDAVLFEDPVFVRSKVQAQLSKPLNQRAYQELFDDPARLRRDRAVLQCLTQVGASEW